MNKKSNSFSLTIGLSTVVRCRPVGGHGPLSAQPVNNDPEAWTFRGGLSGEFQVISELSHTSYPLMDPDSTHLQIFGSFFIIPVE